MALPSMNSEFLNVSLFGSAARGNTDSLSDLDVVVIVKDGSGKVSPREIEIWASAQYPRIVPSISWYSESKIIDFYSSGDLFAWHLFMESVPIMGFRPLSDVYGRPEEYRDAKYVIEELIQVITSVGRNVETKPYNVIFESGVLYVCLRNIAMAASWHLCDAPNFMRRAPFYLPEVPFPMCLDEYDLMARCRMAGQRGAELPNVSLNKLIYWIDRSMGWAETVRSIINGRA